MGNWTIEYTDAEVVDGLESFEDCLTAVQRRFSDCVQDIDWRRPYRGPRDEPTFVEWEFFSDTRGEIVARLYHDYR